MSLKIESGYGAIFMKMSCGLNANRIPLALALDALRISIDSLEEASTRLEAKLISTSNKMIAEAITQQNIWAGINTQESINQPVTDIEVNSIISDVWLMIDTIHRVYTIIAKHLPDFISDKGEQTPDFIKHSSSIKGIRDMFQHADDKFDDYFNKYPDSADCVYGRLNWHYKTSEINIHCSLNTGIVPTNKSSYTSGFTPDIVRNMPYNEIHNFTISHLEPIPRLKPNGKVEHIDGKRVYDYKKVDIVIKEIVDYTNKLISTIAHATLSTMKKVASQHGLSLSEFGIQRLYPQYVLAIPPAKDEAGLKIPYPFDIHFRYREDFDML